MNVEFESRGGMILIEDDQHLKVMEEFVEQQRKYGLDVTIVDKSQKKTAPCKEMVLLLQLIVKQILK